MFRELRTCLHVLGAAALCAIAVAPATSHAQQTGTLAGKVTDAATGAPLNGVTVLIGGTTLLGITNDAGEYSIVNIRVGLALVSVQRIGYKARGDSIRIAAGQRVTRDFALDATVSTLSEVVVTGVTGNTQRRAQAAVVASLPVADLVRTAPVTNVNEILQSRLPGVSVSSASGSVGASRQIRIRGAGSVSLSNQPLIFIDGIRVSEAQINPGTGGQITDRLNDINPDDIESIEVVKGPAASTLYGAEASAGVIQIITKKGKLGSNSFAQTLRIDVAQIDQNWDIPSNFALCSASSVAATSVNPLCRGQAVGTLVEDNPLTRTNAFRTGSERNIGWTGRGGGSNYGYFLSATSDKSLGTLPANSFERIGFRSNVNFVPNAKVKIDIGLNVLESDTQLPQNDNNGFGFLGGHFLGNPLTRRDDGGPGNDGWFGFNRQVEQISSIEASVQSRRSQVNVLSQYQPFDWFTNRLNVGADFSRDEVNNFIPRNSTTSFGGNNDTGDRDVDRIGLDRFTIDYLGNVRTTLGDEAQWGVNFSGGFQSIITRQDVTSASGFGFVTNSANSVNNASTRTGGQSFSETKQIGYIGELQISSRDRRFLQLGARIDQNSSFGEGAPSFFLPKVGVSWVISEEDFFAPLTGFLNQLRLRAAWGTTGRAPFPGAALTTFAAAPFAITGVAQAGAIPSNPGNDTLQAERGTEYEMGFEATAWNDRLGLEVTYFNKTTTDLLLQTPLPPSLGFLTNPFANIGEVLNSGVEVSLTANLLRTNNFEWELRAGGNTLRNELVSLGGENAFGTLNRFTEGFQLGSFVTQPVRSINEATGQVVVADTLEVVGNIMPTLEWNVSNSFTLFKNFRITALLDAKSDFSVFNNTDFFRETQFVRGENRVDVNKLSRRERLRRYGNDTPGQPGFVTEAGLIPGCTVNCTSNVNNAREAYIQAGDFIRLRELSLTYSLPRSLAQRIGLLSGATITIAGQNLALWTDYEGADPEVISAAAGNFSRTDFLTLPNARRFVFKTNFTF